MTDHIFIVNPAAGKADRTEFITKAAQSASADGNVTVYATKSPGDATAYVESVLASATRPVRIYACGGDGTVHEVVQGIYNSHNSNVSFGVIPTGSGNDFIRSFQIPESSFRSIRAMMRGGTVPCDLMRVTDDSETERICINVASAGFDAAVCRRMQSFRRVPLMGGSVAYNAALVRQFLGHLGHRFTIIADGEEIHMPNKDEYLFALLANGSHYGGGYRCSPQSELNDGLLNMILIESIPRSQFAGLLGPYRKGEYFEKLGDRMLHKRVRSMQFLSDETIDMNLDGEIIALQNPCLSVIPSAINLILPA